MNFMVDTFTSAKQLVNTNVHISPFRFVVFHTGEHLNS